MLLGPCSLSALGKNLSSPPQLLVLEAGQGPGGKTLISSYLVSPRPCFLPPSMCPLLLISPHSSRMIHLEILTLIPLQSPSPNKVSGGPEFGAVGGHYATHCKGHCGFNKSTSASTFLSCPCKSLKSIELILGGKTILNNFQRIDLTQTTLS